MDEGGEFGPVVKNKGIGPVLNLWSLDMKILKSNAH